MTAHDALTWPAIPGCDLDRAQRFYEALLDIASSATPCRPSSAAAPLGNSTRTVAPPARAVAALLRPGA
jgi:hypothetical protein